MPTRINIKEKRPHKIKSHFGVIDYLRFYRENYSNTVDKDTYRIVLKELNEKVRDEIASRPYDFRMPLLGSILVRKYIPPSWIDKEGRIKHRRKINFKKTLDLWEENKEARDNKIKVYYENNHSNDYIFKVFYNKSATKYPNKSVYKMQINRTLKNRLGANILNQKVDSFVIT